MSTFNWKREADRIRKVRDEIAAMHARLLKSDSDTLGWDGELAKLYESLDLTAKQLELQIDQRSKRVRP